MLLDTLVEYMVLMETFFGDHTSYYCPETLHSPPCQSKHWWGVVPHNDICSSSRTYENWSLGRPCKPQGAIPWPMLCGWGLQLSTVWKWKGWRVPINLAAVNRFQDCLSLCALDDLGANGIPFTWHRGELFERLDRAVANSDWRATFPTASVTNISLPFSDHCVVWLRMNLV